MIAAEADQLEILKYLKQRRTFHWVCHHWVPHVDICKSAARNGSLEMLQWARENGCP